VKRKFASSNFVIWQCRLEPREQSLAPRASEKVRMPRKLQTDRGEWTFSSSDRKKLSAIKGWNSQAKRKLEEEMKTEISQSESRLARCLSQHRKRLNMMHVSSTSQLAWIAATMEGQMKKAQLLMHAILDLKLELQRDPMAEDASGAESGSGDDEDSGAKASGDAASEDSAATGAEDAKGEFADNDDLEQILLQQSTKVRRSSDAVEVPVPAR